MSRLSERVLRHMETITLIATLLSMWGVTEYSTIEEVQEAKCVDEWTERSALGVGISLFFCTIMSSFFLITDIDGVPCDELRSHFDRVGLLLY